MSLSPRGVAPACLGYPLTVTCSVKNLSRSDVIQWNITTNVEGRSESRQRLISAGGQSLITPLMLNMITFNFTFETISDPDVSSLTVNSDLSVQDVTTLLNETVIKCSAFTQNSVVGQESINVHVITSESIDSGKWRIITVIQIY